MRSVKLPSTTPSHCPPPLVRANILSPSVCWHRCVDTDPRSAKYRNADTRGFPSSSRHNDLDLDVLKEYAPLDSGARRCCLLLHLEPSLGDSARKFLTRLPNFGAARLFSNVKPSSLVCSSARLSTFCQRRSPHPSRLRAPFPPSVLFPAHPRTSCLKSAPPPAATLRATVHAPPAQVRPLPLRLPPDDALKHLAALTFPALHTLSCSLL
ncbi:hypothetical protein C8R46DRAFT_1114848, partial [Mycena filopes]